MRALCACTRVCMCMWLCDRKRDQTPCVCVSHEDVGRRAAVCVCVCVCARVCVCVCVRARACGLCPAVTGSGRSVPSAPPEPVTRGGSGGPQHVFIVLFW